MSKTQPTLDDKVEAITTYLHACGYWEGSGLHGQPERDRIKLIVTEVILKYEQLNRKELANHIDRITEPQKEKGIP